GDAGGPDHLAVLAEDARLERLEPGGDAFGVDKGLLEPLVAARLHDLLVVRAISLGELAWEEIEVRLPEHVFGTRAPGGVRERRIHGEEAALAIFQPRHVGNV